MRGWPEGDGKITRTMKTRYMMVGLLLLFLLPGCAGAEENGTPAATPRKRSPTPDPTRTPADTSGTSVPFPTVSITPSPYLSSPAPAPAAQTLMPTPTPFQREPITAENAGQLEEIMRWGAPVVWDAVLSGDSTRLIAATSGGVIVFDAETGERLQDIPLIPLQRNALAVNRDGSRILIVTREDVQLYDSSTQSSQSIFQFPEGSDG